MKMFLYCSISFILFLFLTFSAFAIFFYICQLFKKLKTKKKNYVIINELINKILFAFTFVSTILFFIIEMIMKINNISILKIIVYCFTFSIIAFIYFIIVFYLYKFIYKFIQMFIKKFNVKK